MHIGVCPFIYNNSRTIIFQCIRLGILHMLLQKSRHCHNKIKLKIYNTTLSHDIIFTKEYAYTID